MINKTAQAPLQSIIPVYGGEDVLDRIRGEGVPALLQQDIHVHWYLLLGRHGYIS